MLTVTTGTYPTNASPVFQVETTWSHFHIVLTRNTRGVFVGYKLTKLF